MQVSISRFRDTEIPPYTRQYAAAAEIHKILLKIEEADVTLMRGKTVEFEDCLNAVVAAESALKEAIQAKDHCRISLEDMYNGYTNQFQPNPDCTDEIRAALNITIRDKKTTPNLPQKPEELNADGSPTGVNHLNWKPGDNKKGMQYVIEAMKAGETAFTMVDFTSKTKYDHKGQKPGVQITYQVRAKKGELLSAPSNAAVVYPAGELE
jgi:hypothetical protein